MLHMLPMMNRLRTWLRSEKGQAMSEYGLVLAIAAVGVIAVLIAFRDELRTIFTSIIDSMKNGTSS